MNILLQIDDFLKKHDSVAICIIVNTKGSTPRKAGSKMLVASNGTTLGSIGGGILEMRAIEQAKHQITSCKPTYKFLASTSSTGADSGEGIHLYIEPIGNPPDLYIFGGGHTGRALAEIAPRVGFRITILDFRPLPDDRPETLPFRYIQGDYIESIVKLDFHKNTYIAIMSPSHEDDFRLLKILGKKKFRYLGMLASTKKVAKAKELLVASGHFTQEEFSRFDTPMGLPLKAETPEEIAISIAGKLIEIKNQDING